MKKKSDVEPKVTFSKCSMGDRMKDFTVNVQKKVSQKIPQKDNVGSDSVKVKIVSENDVYPSDNVAEMEDLRKRNGNLIC